MPINSSTKRFRLQTIVTVMLVVVVSDVSATHAQEEVTSYIQRYRERELSSGYYEQYEMKPSGQRPLVGVPGLSRSRGIFPYSPSAAQIRVRRRLADSHRGIKFYTSLTCAYCHPGQATDHHTVRSQITCRQCHGGEPIASIDHFYSPLNPIRRHAYVCAKCHEGASASFGSYIIHEPPAGTEAARIQFPLLFYAYWFMSALLIGTLIFFIPHSFLFGIRELVAKLIASKKKHGSIQD